MPRDPRPSSLRRRDANARATRQAIIAVGRARFAAQGFAGTALDEIVSAAGVTTGAVYHHFQNKKGLFQAVAESVEQEILDAIVAGLPPDSNPWQQVEYGIAKTLELCTDPEVRRIIFTDAPNVIGVSEWRAIELRYGFGLLRERLAQLERSGELRAGSVALTAQILLGALMEAAHAVALSDNTERAIRDAKTTLSAFVRSLGARGGQGSSGDADPA